MKSGEDKTEKRGGELIAAADFGGGAVRVLVAETLEGGGFRLTGAGEAASDGVKEGRVVNMEKAVAALKNALQEAEIMSHRRLMSVWASITGEQIISINATGSTVVADPDGVSVSDIRQVKQMAEAELAGLAARQSEESEVSRSARRVIATLEREYELDGQKGVQKPLGMSGNKLSGEMHLILAPTNALADWEKCLLQCGVEIEEQFVFSALAAAKAVLTKDEKELGVCIADIGASTTDVAIFRRGLALQTFCEPLASGDIHRDIATMHHTSLESAEQAKKMIGLSDESQEMALLQKAGGGGESEESSAVVRDTIAHRVDEILEKIDAGLSRAVDSNGHHFSGSVVLTGDGSLLPGLEETAKKKLNSPVRIGRPLYRGEHHERVSSPRFAVAMGLLQHATEARAERAAARASLRPMDGVSSFFRKIFGSVRSDAE